MKKIVMSENKQKQLKQFEAMLNFKKVKCNITNGMKLTIKFY